MVFNLLDWQYRKELVLVISFVCILVVWLQESLSLGFLFPLRLLAGLFLAVFPVGFLFLSIFFQEKDAMSKPEWLAYSIAVSIAFFSFGAILANLILNENNSIWLALRIILLLSVLFFLVSKTRQYFGKVD